MRKVSGSKFCSLAFLLLVVICGATGCDSGFQTMEAGQFGVVFVALPPPVGGGVRQKSIQPGEMEFIFPWETLYRLDTTVQSIGWGGRHTPAVALTEEAVETRAFDGNEVGLAVTVQYHVDPKKVDYVIQRVGIDDAHIRDLVAAVARADIRTHLNILNTKDFFIQSKRQAAMMEAKQAMAARLHPEGIIIDEVIYNDHRFERPMGEGQYDRSYQEKIDQTQATNQTTEQEIKKIDTVIAEQRTRYNEEQARVNRAVEEVQGYLDQAKLRGDSYLQAKKIEAEEIEIAGKNEIAGLVKQISALSGPGGEALLRLELVEQLLKNKPRFVLINSGSGGQGGLDLTRIDTNELIRQAGLFAAAHEAVSGEEKKPGEQPAVAPDVVTSPLEQIMPGTAVPPRRK